VAPGGPATRKNPLAFVVPVQAGAHDWFAEDGVTFAPTTGVR